MTRQEYELLTSKIHDLQLREQELQEQMQVVAPSDDQANNGLLNEVFGESEGHSPSGNESAAVVQNPNLVQLFQVSTFPSSISHIYVSFYFGSKVQYYRI